ncbi:hypothetical protein LTR36_005848 [Oleoguttula mirabilis]|uniref:Uncharacterized protein n=1 Tax=Oleoguttula mirabilis TaxID=1507867 RepID=A0AAV9JDI2_9PEZI|nr:hypothetical protein LTR36_005848 [Oleoguttula mirabilis]
MSTGLHIPSAGLVVRKTEEGRYLIVGQAIFNPEIAPCTGSPSNDDGSGRDTRVNISSGCGCSSGEEYHVKSDRKWTVHFAPEDLLLFITQDLAFHDRPKEKDTALMVDLYVRPEEAAKRLRTRVTSSQFSSYAVCAPISSERSPSPQHPIGPIDEVAEADAVPSDEGSDDYLASDDDIIDEEDDDES